MSTKPKFYYRHYWFNGLFDVVKVYCKKHHATANHHHKSAIIGVQCTKEEERKNTICDYCAVESGYAESLNKIKASALALMPEPEPGSAITPHLHEKRACIAAVQILKDMFAAKGLKPNEEALQAMSDFMSQHV